MSIQPTIPCCAPARAPPSTAFDRMVTIRVGNGEEPDVDLHVYRGLLCHHSTTFQKLLGSQSDEPALIDISGEADTVRLFFRWLNTGSLADHGLPSWQDIIDAYLVAESFGVRSLQNHALDMFLRKHAESNEVPVNAAHIVYQESSPADPFRRLLIRVVAERWGFERSRDTEQELPSTFWHDLVDHLRIQSRAPGNLAVPRKEWIEQECRTFCDRFHVHTKEEKDSNDSEDPELPNVQHLEIATERGDIATNKSVENRPDCDKCGGLGHFAMFCPFRKSGARLKCFNCDGFDHVAMRCPEPKDWSKHRCSLCKKYGHNRARCTAKLHVPKDGTAGTPFIAHVEKDPDLGGGPYGAHFQSITCQLPYKNASWEELRLVDYQQKRRYSDKTSRY